MFGAQIAKQEVRIIKCEPVNIKNNLCICRQRKQLTNMLTGREQKGKAAREIPKAGIQNRATTNKLTAIQN